MSIKDGRTWAYAAIRLERKIHQCLTPSQFVIAGTAIFLISEDQ
jgi:hypothetical protein